MPRDARSYANTSSSLVVKWSPPISPNGNATFYLLRWQQQPEDRELYQHNYCSKGKGTPFICTPFPSYIEPLSCLLLILLTLFLSHFMKSNSQEFQIPHLISLRH